MQPRITAIMVLVCCLLGWSVFSCDPRAGRTPDGTGQTQDSGNQQADKTTTPDPTTPPPDRRDVPEPRTTPDQATTPDPTTTPDQATTPDPGTQPDQSTPDPTTTPDQSTTPDPTTTPDQSTTPDQTPDAGTPDKAPTVSEYSFIALGDTGTGSAKQKAVAQAVKNKCDAEAKPGGRGKCNFAILLGDNFYDVGVDSATDKLFKSHFADMYHMLGFPFYITIGNHDFGVNGIGGTGFGFHKLKYYLDYAKTDPKFVLPSSFYTFKEQHTTFIALNTAELFFDYNLKAQTTFIKQTIAAAQSSTWRIAFGHHPYISNGTHGNAGKYEGIPIPIPYVSGTAIKKFFDNEICGKVDFYFCGHDHNIQLLEPKCGVNFVVSGAGAKNKNFGDKNRNKSIWQSDNTLGFIYVHVKGKTLTLQIIDDKGVVKHQKVYTK